MNIFIHQHIRESEGFPESFSIIGMFLQYGFLDVYLHIPCIYKDHLQHVLFCVSGGFPIFYTLIVFFSTVDFFMPSKRAGPKEYFRTCFTYIYCLSCVTSFVSL